MCLIDWVDLEIGIKVRVEDGTMRPEKVGGLECWKRLHLETAIPWIWSYCEGQSRGISYKTAWCHVWSKEPFRDSSSRVYTITCLNDCYSFFFLSLWIYNSTFTVTAYTQSPNRTLSKYIYTCERLVMTYTVRKSSKYRKIPKAVRTVNARAEGLQEAPDQLLAASRKNEANVSDIQNPLAEHVAVLKSFSTKSTKLSFTCPSHDPIL